MNVKIFKINQDKTLIEVENKIKIKIEEETEIKNNEKINLKATKLLIKQIEKLEMCVNNIFKK